MDAHRAQTLAALHQAVLDADFSLSMADTVVEVNKDEPIDGLKALIDRYDRHADEIQKTEFLVATYNQVAAEQMAAFQEEAIDLVDEFLREKCKEVGVEYEPPPNPYRR